MNEKHSKYFFIYARKKQQKIYIIFKKNDRNIYDKVKNVENVVKRKILLKNN